MKYLLLLLLAMMSFSTIAGNDKGNVGGETYASSTQDLLIQYGLDLHEITYATLREKRAVVISGKISFLELETLAITQGKRRPETIPLVVLIKELLRRNELELLKSITTESNEFYEAMSTKDLISQVDSLTVSNEQKLMATNLINGIARTFWKSIQQEVVKELGSAAWAIFAKSADVNRLGYSIENER